MFAQIVKARFVEFQQRRQTMFFEILKNLCKEKGTTPTTVVKQLGLSSSSATSWKNGKVPHHGTLLKLADYFGVTVDYLLGSETAKKEKPADEGELSDAERLLIESLRKVPEEQQEMVVQMIRAALNAQ